MDEITGYSATSEITFRRSFPCFSLVSVQLLKNVSIRFKLVNAEVRYKLKVSKRVTLIILRLGSTNSTLIYAKSEISEQKSSYLSRHQCTLCEIVVQMYKNNLTKQDTAIPCIYSDDNSSPSFKKSLRGTKKGTSFDKKRD